MSTVPQPRYTPEEYLARERRAATKSEYYRGEIFAMACASREHNLIVTNLVRELSSLLRDRPCEVYPSDMRVKVSPTGLYTYPDVTVVCGPPRFEDREVDTLLNPTVLFEVASETTAAYDRGPKARQYRQLDSLQQLVLVAQDEPHVEVYTRQPGGDWKLNEAANLVESVAVASIGVSLALAEVYRGVEFPPRDETKNPAAIG